MMMNVTKKIVAALLIAFSAGSAMAQVQERTYTLNPATLTPAPTGYYIGGVTKTVNGNPTFFNGCVDEYGDANHNEAGMQQGFTYGGAMIMPTCAGKGTPPEGYATPGYIQLTKHKLPGTQDATFGFIRTPQVTNIKSLEIMAGTDVSLNASRRAFMAIETSLDGGTTWNVGPYLEQELTNQGGHIFTYQAGGSNPAFNNIATRSNTQPMMIRIITFPAPGATEGQRLKIHGVKLVATGSPVMSLKSELANNEPFFEIKDNAFVANESKGSLFVYSMTGALVGSGNEVAIPRKGLFIVRSDKGLTKKVFLQ